LYDSVYASVIDDWAVFEVGADTSYYYTCPNGCLSDLDGDGVCDADEIVGCPDTAACNFDASATDDNGSCQYPFDLHGIDYVDCAGDCLSDLDTDGVCTESDNCEDLSACNFDDASNGLCQFIDACGFCGGPGPDVPAIASITLLYDSVYADIVSEWVVFESGADTTFYYTCANGCLSDIDGDGVCDLDEIAGCQDETSCNYDPAATDDNGSCAGLPDECGVCEGTGAPCPCGSPVEFDGYSYATVEIGDQCWFQENLRSEHYLNGDLIPGDQDGSIWNTASIGLQSYYNNDSSNLAIYGRLYNWYAVDDARGLCPTGWHVPTDGEWTVLTDFLGGSSVAGGKMKEAGTAHWNSPNTGADNSSGFTGLGSGYRWGNSSYNVLSYDYFWSSSPSGSNAWYRRLDYNSAGVYRDVYRWKDGFSVRCALD